MEEFTRESMFMTKNMEWEVTGGLMGDDTWVNGSTVRGMVRGRLSGWTEVNVREYGRMTGG